MNLKRVSAIALVLVLSVAAVFLLVPASKVKIVRSVHAQSQWGATTPIGFAAAAVNFVPLTTSTGAAGTVTNVASNFLIQVDGGPVWCNGGQDQIPEDNIQLAASTTYLIVYNCGINAVYAKTAITAPGNAPGPGGVGIPTQLLFAANGEVALATVVCNATACGNGGNGSITDNRNVNLFPVGHMLTQVTFANLPATYPNGAMVYCSTCTLPAAPATCVGAGTGSIAFRINGAWVCP